MDEKYTVTYKRRDRDSRFLVSSNSSQVPTISCYLHGKMVTTAVTSRSKLGDPTTGRTWEDRGRTETV